MLSRRSVLLTPLMLVAPRVSFAIDGKMTLCLHTNTSSGAGYRGALEGWARAGIKHVELNAALVDDFLKMDTLEGARKVLADNGLTAVHGAVGVNGLLEPNPNHADAIETFKKRLEMFAFLGVKKVYTTSGGTQKLTTDDYTIVADHMRVVGDTAKAFDMVCSVEFVRSSPYMSTLLTALKVTREAAHPNFGVMFDFYHFWSGLNKLEDMDQIRPGEIQHVHFQDVPDMPRELLDNNSRFIPGDGVSPIVPMLQKLAEKGYSGPLSVELFLPRFRDGSPYEIAREVRQKCEAVMGRARVL
ncbi:MAG: sugar phosphate isomerase/epimerase [Steroidobacteraceae bacterium]